MSDITAEFLLAGKHSVASDRILRELGVEFISIKGVRVFPTNYDFELEVPQPHGTYHKIISREVMDERLNGLNMS